MHSCPTRRAACFLTVFSCWWVPNQRKSFASVGGKMRGLVMGKVRNSRIVLPVRRFLIHEWCVPGDVSAGHHRWDVELKWLFICSADKPIWKQDRQRRNLDSFDQ